MGHPFAFIAEWNTLLPLAYFIEDPIRVFTRGSEKWSKGLDLNQRPPRVRDRYSDGP